MNLQGTFYTVEAFLNDAVNSEQREQIAIDLQSEKWLDTVEYVSEEEAFAIFAEHFSNQMISMVGENPLPASFKMHIAEEYQTPGVLREWIQILEHSGYYDAVQAPVAFAEKLSEWRFKMFFWPSVCIVLLLLTLGLIIGNAVRLSLYSRKILVENMKYTGASRLFIEFPFVLEGMVQGFVASLSASVVVAFVAESIGEKFSLASVALTGNLLPIVITTVAVTVLAGCVSLRAVRSFLDNDRGADS